MNSSVTIQIMDISVVRQFCNGVFKDLYHRDFRFLKLT